MRDDAIGMFWEDKPKEKGQNRIAAIMPDIPDTGWTMPTELPNLSASTVLSIDVETWDPDLLTRGPGWARGVGHLVGVSIADDRGGCWYFPLRHEIEPELNWDAEVVLCWLRKTLGDPKQPKIGANIIYDIGWLREEGVIVKGELFDVQFAEALLDESASVALETLGQKYLNEGKASSLLYQWCSDYYGGAVNANQRENIYRSPARLVGHYAESDADLPLKIIAKQWPLLVKEGLMDVFMMECEMINLYVEMRYQGVSVNIPYAEKLSEDLIIKEADYQRHLDKMVGFPVNVGSGPSLAKAFTKLGVPFPKTRKGNPSFTGAFLDKLNHPLGQVIRDVRKHQKLRSTFVQSYILDSNVDGKVYGQFHPLRSEKGGTRSGRYSSSTPNLQNIPSRDEILAPMIRGLFIPDPGHACWRKYDYSQIEYRFMVHYAVGEPGVRARAMFNENPDLDYHNFAQELIFEKTGLKIARKPIKGINFGLIYGMGNQALADTLNMPLKETRALVKTYFEAVDFAKPTMDSAMREAQETGIITTLMGRKSRFELWEPCNFDRNSKALPLDKALMAYGQIRRAATHKALNRKLQGSAADLMKKAMHQCWVDGVFDDIGVPRLTVHDELDFSDPGGKDEGFKEMKHIMENAIPLSIPIKADGEWGPDWGHITDIPV